MESRKYAYLFAEGNSKMRELLGGKGANLAEMTDIGLPVPPGLTITTKACNSYYEEGRNFPQGMEEQLKEAIKDVEQKTGKEFGSQNNPLLLSVRSGSVVSMPGMMDTILNLGLTDETIKGLAQSTNDQRFAYDCYRRFIQMFSDVVMGVEHYQFESILEEYKMKREVKFDYELTADDLKELVEDYKVLVKRNTGRTFPQKPIEQLEMAIKAVFDSWNNHRARVYRKINNIPDHLGTAVNVQSMVFGNMGNDCGTGVAFTRNPSTGENLLYGEYLINAQGEDVVAGIRTPEPIASLEQDMPHVYQQFVDICNKLESHYRDMQDIEFTIEGGKLYMLQTRSGKRTAAAAVKIAYDMVDEGVITKEEAIMRIDPLQIDQLLHRRIDPEAKLTVIAKGLPASPGAASGKVIFDANKAEELGKAGEKVLLVRTETTPDDIHGIVIAQGILTSRGGMTSHAAVVARGMGKPCVCGCEAVKIDYKEKVLTIGDKVIKEGEMLSIDGSAGNVVDGNVPMIDPELSSEFLQILQWADEKRELNIRANADTPNDATKAREFGAEGIGLCRTEHMFMAQERLPIVQDMILAENQTERQEALDKLLPMQQDDFYGILKSMAGLPVTIRLLDPPLHEFLPSSEDLITEITKLKITESDLELLAEKEKLLKQVRVISEFNPMLGHRGCRLGVTFPEVYAMQARAILQAVADLRAEGVEVYPEIMIPLVIHREELKRLKQLVLDVAAQVEQERGITLTFTVGTMIEMPRACVTADEIAQEAQFFSFGTNDLTQTTFGFSRDDAEGKFLHHYVDQGIIENNPFAVLDRDGVGKLMKTAVKLGREAKPDLKMGICGEHGGDPSSIEFCQQLGLNYVSCSPFRIPIARLAAAQAAINNKDQ
ncbi:pyruvate,orthophosphate dikinase [Desulfitispora alkaliphila]|uniref:pyruvate, phosphate dikinase n=1 Tax=Desulfitispora alkaliphila TaxID=622674 RepID=UPI003D1BC908